MEVLLVVEALPVVEAQLAVELEEVAQLVVRMGAV